MSSRFMWKYVAQYISSENVKSIIGLKGHLIFIHITEDENFTTKFNMSKSFTWNKFVYS